MQTEIARHSDPASSHAAAKEITSSGERARQCDLALRMVTEHPGCTSLELSTLKILDRYQTARRLPELEKAGWVRRGPIRQCKVGARPAVTWFPSVPDGSQAELFSESDCA
jgi:hypothetical protein